MNCSHSLCNIPLVNPVVISGRPTLCPVCSAMLDALKEQGGIFGGTYRTWWEQAEAEHQAKLEHKRSLISGEGYTH